MALVVGRWCWRPLEPSTLAFPAVFAGGTALQPRALPFVAVLDRLGHARDAVAQTQSDDLTERMGRLNRGDDVLNDDPRWIPPR